MSTSDFQAERLHRIAAANLFDDAVVAECVAKTDPLEPVDAGNGAFEISTFGLVELILKRPQRLEQLIRQPETQPELVARFLQIAIVGFVFFGVAISLVLGAAHEWPVLTPIQSLITNAHGNAVGFRPSANGLSSLKIWLDGSAFKLIAAYSVGLIAATGICLPSLYFYSLLAGVRMTMLDVVVQALKAKATAAVALVGILPIYAAIGLGIVIFPVPELLRHGALWLGLVLPLMAGLMGTRSLYFGLAGFTDTLPNDRRFRRECFLRRLVLSWSACYTAVTPVMIHTLWVAMTGAA